MVGASATTVNWRPNGTWPTVNGMECIDFNYYGTWKTAEEQCTGWTWCATEANAAGNSYKTYSYCGVGNNTASSNPCVPMIYSGVEYQNCTLASTSGWCATSTYYTGSYYSYR